MCGILGSWHPDDRHPAGLEHALATIAHRGPDGEGWHDQGHCRLGHRRLSIVDPAGGRQPLLSEDGGWALIHNGEIYNHRLILATLAGDHHPRSRSDGEAWLHAAEERGPLVATRQLHGMYALAATDGRRLVLARDPLGIKPLYWSRHDGGVVFASEIKALLPLVPVGTIQAFPAGSVWLGEGEPSALWQVPPGWQVSDDPVSADKWADTLLASLDDAVRLRLMADVPIGVFLSGGVDSSLIAALMRRHLGELHSFAVGLPGSNDLQRAREAATAIRTIHHELVIDPGDLWEAIEPVIHHLESWDPDLVRSALPCWFASRLAAQRVKVVLTGEGADELFAGYAYHGAYSTEATFAGALQEELRRSVAHLHHINLQRVDRMSMAHGLEARVPFLDTRVIDLALRIPPALKLAKGFHKHLLRLVASRLLPPEIAWRAKEPFDQGAGVDAVIRQRLPSEADERSCFHAVFRRHFPEAIDHLVAMWQSQRIPVPRMAVGGQHA